MFLNDGLGRGNQAEGLGQLAECVPSTHQALGSVYKYPINQAYKKACDPSIQKFRDILLSYI